MPNEKKNVKLGHWYCLYVWYFITWLFRFIYFSSDFLLLLFTLAVLPSNILAHTILLAFFRQVGLYWPVSCIKLIRFFFQFVWVSFHVRFYRQWFNILVRKIEKKSKNENIHWIWKSSSSPTHSGNGYL